MNDGISRTAKGAWQRMLKRILRTEEAASGSLTKLDLSDCELGRVGRELKQLFRKLFRMLPGLQSLNLAFNDMGVEGAKALAANLPTSLTSIDLHQNCIGDEGVKALVQRLPGGLSSLVLSSNSIGLLGARALGRKIPRTLINLDLGWNSIGHEGVKALVQTLPSRLRSLVLYESGIGDEGAIALGRKIPRALTGLNLASNSIGPKGVKALARMLPKSLSSLTLYDNRVGDEGAKALAPCLPLALTTLDLRSNSIGDEGAKALAPCLPVALTNLDLSNNRIGVEGAKALAQMLPRRLTDLDVRHNCIGVEGAKALAHKLPRGLSSLDLGCNSIGDEGAKALAQNLPRTLARLGLHTNGIGVDGAKALAENLPASLTELLLGGNNVGDQGAKALAKQLPASLMTLDLSQNAIADGAVRAMTRLASLEYLDMGDNPHVSSDAMLDLLEALLPESIRLDGENESGWQGITLDVHYCVGLGLSDAELNIRDAESVYWALMRKREVGLKPLLEVKLVILGMGRIGKSSLVTRMISNGKERYTGEITHDVDIHRMRPKDFLGGKVTCRVYDFGGQTELHATHRFFLRSRRLCYMVLLDGGKRPADEINNFDYWLRMIGHHASSPKTSSPVVVVLGRADEWNGGKAVIERKHVLERAAELGMKENVFVVDRYWDHREKGCDGLEKVRDAVNDAIASMSYVFKQKYDRGFDKMLSWCEGKGTEEDFPNVIRPAEGWKHLSVDHFRDACRCVRCDGEMEQDIYLAELAGLGVIHWIGDRDEVRHHNPEGVAQMIFNPAWVKGPAYAIVSAAPAAYLSVGGMWDFLKERHLIAQSTKKRGEQAWWGNLQWEAGDRDKLLKLMLACDLIFETNWKTGSRVKGYLVPDKLPALGCKWDDVDCRWEDWQWVLECRFLGEDVFNRLIGRMVDFVVKDQLCKDRALLRDADCGEAVALVRADVYGCRLYVRLGGGSEAERRDLLKAIKITLDQIRERQEGDEWKRSDFGRTEKTGLPPEVARWQQKRLCCDILRAMGRGKLYFPKDLDGKAELNDATLAAIKKAMTFLTRAKEKLPNGRMKGTGCLELSDPKDWNSGRRLTTEGERMKKLLM